MCVPRLGYTAECVFSIFEWTSDFLCLIIYDKSRSIARKVCCSSETASFELTSSFGFFGKFVLLIYLHVQYMHKQSLILMKDLITRAGFWQLGCDRRRSHYFGVDMDNLCVMLLIFGRITALFEMIYYVGAI